MKLTSSKIVVIFFLLSSLPSFSQELKKRKWNIIVSSGVAIPVGSYGNANASSSAIIPQPENFLAAFNKSESGFAKTGYYINSEIQFRLKKGVFFLIRGGKIQNSVQTQSLSEFLTQRFNTPVSVAHDDYKLYYITPGIGLSKTHKNFEFGFNVFIGYASCSYPYYKGVLLNSNTDPKIIWAHDGDRPTLESLTLGSGAFLRYTLLTQLSIGLDCSFQTAQFHYKISNRQIPGGSNIYEVEDTLKFALVNIGISLGYKF